MTTAEVLPVLLKRTADARVVWPFIERVEIEHRLPQFILYAVGFRETGLRNVVGDHGHGYGVWQRDNRSWNVGVDYLHDVLKQCEDAASLLVVNYQALHTWNGALAAYNCGVGGVRRARAHGLPDDAYTTSGNYGVAVLGYRASLENHFAPQPSPHPAPLPHPQPHPHTAYVVKPGDTLTSIAKHYHMTVKALAAFNHIANADIIRVGQHIIIP